jgi:hypothetical protein
MTFAPNESKNPPMVARLRSTAGAAYADSSNGGLVMATAREVEPNGLHTLTARPYA